MFPAPRLCSLKFLKAACLTLALGCSSTSIGVSALAQTPAETDAALGRLSEILGALSHLEVICERDERSRTDMEAVLASEALSRVRQSVLIDAFNRGFRAVASKHQRCTSSSERLIDLHHQRGASIVANLLDG